MADGCDNSELLLTVWRIYRKFRGKYGMEYVVRKLEMPQAEIERLVNIRIIKRCSGGVKLEKQYQSINNPFIPASPFERRIVTKEDPLPIVKSEYYDY